MSLSLALEETHVSICVHNQMTNTVTEFVCPQSPPRRKLIKPRSGLLSDQGDRVIQ